MIITKKHLSRRLMLRGLGATLALPLLDGMVPALSAFARTTAKSPMRFGTVYVPNGIHMEDWTPAAADGAGFECTPILKPLEAFRDRTVVLTGLDSRGSGHVRASTAFLTDMPPQAGSDIRAGISLDQYLAKEIGQDTQLTSFEVALETAETGGSCETGISCTYLNTISWRTATTPLPMEYNPRLAFERLFGDSESTDPAARAARSRKNRSLLDSLTEKIGSLQRVLGPSDRNRLGEYLEAVRDVERRIQTTEARNIQLPVIDQPTSIPATCEEHAKLMFDLQVLAYQSDLTRVTTFMVGREFSGRTYAEIGVPDSHHPTSHHAGDPEKLAKLTKINTFHASLLAYFLDKLRTTPDGDGSLLDHSLILYGSGLSDGNAHSCRGLPVLLAGGPTLLKGGRHLRFPDGTPLANLHLTLLGKYGVPLEHIGDSTGTFKELAAV